MAPCTVTSRRTLRGLAALVALALPAGADTTVSTVPLAPHGNAVRGSAGQPVALSPTAFLASTAGADGDRGTADDITLLVKHADGSPTLTPLATPFLSSWSGRSCVLSASSALVFAAGPDGSWGTEDDLVHLLTGLGSANDVTPIPIGALSTSAGTAPVRLSATTAVICSLGPDGDDDTADDEVVVITDVGGTNQILRASAPWLYPSYISRPIRLSPTSFLLGSRGPDTEARTADDTTYLFTLEDGALVRTDISTPRLLDGAPGRASRVSATRAVVASGGLDGDDSTSDDLLYLLDDLGGTNTVTEIPVGSIFDYSAGHAVALTDSVVVLCSPGPDETDRTADDGLLVVSGLGSTNSVQLVTLGAIDEDRQCRPLRLSPTSCAVVTGGPDSSFESEDDTVAIITDVGGTNAMLHVPVPTLAGGATSTPVAVGATGLLLRCGGDDHSTGGDDDLVAFVSGLDGTPVTEVFPTGPAPGDNYSAAQVPVLLGAGRAVFLIGGADGVIGDGGDDALRIIDGLPQPRGLTVRKVWIKYKETKPQKGARFSVSGTAMLDTPALFARDDVTVSVGNAAQTIPAAAFKQNRKGTIFTYADRKGRAGFLTKVRLDTRKGALTIAGKGVATGGETSDPAYVPVVLECGDLWLATAVSGERKKAGIRYKAPRR